MTQTIRVSLPGKDAGTSTNLDDYALYADTDNILIKEKTRGTIDVGSYTFGTITHSLGYVPFFAVYFNNGSQYEWIYGPGAYQSAYAYSGTANLIVRNSTGATKTFHYYIFYDQQV